MGFGIADDADEFDKQVVSAVVGITGPYGGEALAGRTPDDGVDAPAPDNLGEFGFAQKLHVALEDGGLLVVEGEGLAGTPHFFDSEQTVHSRHFEPTGESSGAGEDVDEIHGENVSYGVGSVNLQEGGVQWGQVEENKSQEKLSDTSRAVKKGDKTKRVVMAVNGGKSSIVGAYLLKQQGYEVIGIATLFTYGDGQKDGSFPAKLIQYDIDDIERVKKLCDCLEIPLYAVNAQDDYAYFIGDFFVASAVSCRVFACEVFTTNLILDILLEKADSFGAESIAIGHYAKVSYSTKQRGYVVSASDDLDHDQSYLLSNLKQKHLSKLLLPLAKLRRVDIEKIADFIGGDFAGESDIDAHYDWALLQDYLGKMIPPSLVKEGEVINCMTTEVVGEHTGLDFYPGRSEVPLKHGTLASQFSVVDYCVLQERVFVCPKDALFYTHIFVSTLENIPNLDITKSLSLFVKMGNRSERKSCRFIFKNNGVAVVDFGERIRGFVYPGEYLVFYSRQGPGAVVVASGVCLYSYYEAYGMTFRFPLGKEEKERLESNPVVRVIEGF